MAQIAQFVLLSVQLIPACTHCVSEKERKTIKHIYSLQTKHKRRTHTIPVIIFYRATVNKSRFRRRPAWPSRPTPVYHTWRVRSGCWRARTSAEPAPQVHWPVELPPLTGPLTIPMIHPLQACTTCRRRRRGHALRYWCNARIGRHRVWPIVCT